MPINHNIWKGDGFYPRENCILGWNVCISPRTKAKGPEKMETEENYNPSIVIIQKETVPVWAEMPFRGEKAITPKRFILQMEHRCFGDISCLLIRQKSICSAIVTSHDIEKAYITIHMVEVVGFFCCCFFGWRNWCSWLNTWHHEDKNVEILKQYLKTTAWRLVSGHKWDFQMNSCFYNLDFSF